MANPTLSPDPYADIASPDAPAPPPTEPYASATAAQQAYADQARASQQGDPGTAGNPYYDTPTRPGDASTAHVGLDGRLSVPADQPGGQLHLDPYASFASADPDSSTPQGYALAQARKMVADDAAHGLISPSDRAAMSGMMFGADDEIAGAGAAAGTWLNNILHPGGKLSPSDAFHAVAQANREAKAAYAKDQPGLSFAGNVIGGLANPLSALGGELVGAAPTIGGAALRGAGVGALEGAAYGVGDGDVGGRVSGGLTGALLGGASGGVLGAGGAAIGRLRRAAAPSPVVDDAAPTASEIGQLASAGPRATAADYALTGIDPSLVTDGPASVRKLAAAVAGSPVGGAIGKGLSRRQAQTTSAIRALAGAYGDAPDAATAGGAIVDTNAASADAVASARQDALGSILDLANAGPAPALDRRGAGELVQGAIERYAGDQNAGAGVNPLALPTRATSFPAKMNAGYERVFSQADAEIPGGVTATGYSNQSPLDAFGQVDAPGAPSNWAEEVAAARAADARGPAGAAAGSGGDAQGAPQPFLSLASPGKPKLPTPASPSGSWDDLASQLINPSATRGVLDDIADRSQSPFLKGVLQAPEVKQVAGLVSRPDLVSFNDLRTQRTAIREAQQDPALLRGGVQAADLQRLEGSLTQDIGDNAATLGSPQLAAKLQRMDRLYAGRTEQLQGLRGIVQAQSGESALDALMRNASSGGGANAARLGALSRVLRPGERDQLARAALLRMAQGSSGDFDLGTAVKKYQQLSPEGADAIFGRGLPLKPAMDRLFGDAQSAVDAEPASHFASPTGSTSAEGAFGGFLRAAQGGDIASINAFKAAAPPEAWGKVAAGVLNTLGGAADGPVSPAKWLSGYDKLTPDAKQALFGGAGREQEAQRLDALAATMRSSLSYSKLENHSNSAHTGGALLGLIEGGKTLLEGDFHQAGIMAGLAGLGLGFGHVLARPGAARLLMRMSRAPGSAAAETAGAQLTGLLGGGPQAAALTSAVRRKVMASAPYGAAAQEERGPQLPFRLRIQGVEGGAGR